MKIGDCLYTKIDYIQPIRCGDGIVGSFEIKKNEKYYITDVNTENESIEIKYKNQTIWFTLNSEDTYFEEPYTKYFYTAQEMRKLKLEKLNERN